MRFLIYIPDLKVAQRVFEYTVEAVKEIKLGGDVRNLRNYDLIRQELYENAYAYDGLLLDGLDKSCLNIAELLRKRNLVASVVFVNPDGRIPSDILRYRPSAIVTRLEGGEQLKRALRWTYGEYIRANPVFTIKNKEEILRIPYYDILWFESRQRIVTLHSKRQEISFYAKLSEVQALLPESMFLRCHQSYIVNSEEINRIDKVHSCIYLNTGQSVCISKSYYQEVLSFCGSENFSRFR